MGGFNSPLLSVYILPVLYTQMFIYSDHQRYHVLILQRQIPSLIQPCTFAHVMFVLKSICLSTLRSDKYSIHLNQKYRLMQLLPRGITIRILLTSKRRSLSKAIRHARNAFFRKQKREKCPVTALALVLNILRWSNLVTSERVSKHE